MLKKLKFHHIGYAVNNIDESLKIFSNIGYTQLKRVYDDIQKVELSFLFYENSPLIELVQPTELESPVSAILKKNNNMPYHLCYCVKDIHLTINELRKDGWLLISKIVNAIAFLNRQICFLYHKDFGVIELLETKGEISENFYLS